MSNSISLPYYITPSQCGDLLLIKDDEFPCPEDFQNKDFIVGRNSCVNLTVPGGETIRFRNWIVLGQMTVNSSDPALKAKIICENAIIAGSLIVEEVHLQGENFYNAGTVIFGLLSIKNLNRARENFYNAEKYPEFREALLNRFVEGIRDQREAVNKIGLRSILVEGYPRK